MAANGRHDTPCGPLFDRLKCRACVEKLDGTGEDVEGGLRLLM
jgi:hypothetical protein